MNLFIRRSLNLYNSHVLNLVILELWNYCLLF